MNLPKKKKKLNISNRIDIEYIYICESHVKLVRD